VLRNQGWPVRLIAPALGISKRTVYRRIDDALARTPLTRLLPPGITARPVVPRCVPVSVPRADQLVTEGRMQFSNFVVHWCGLAGNVTQTAQRLRLCCRSLAKCLATAVVLVGGRCARNRDQCDDRCGKE
jgi:hypothetical protein